MADESTVLAATEAYGVNWSGLSTEGSNPKK
jgi:hypothetical protein